MDTMKLQWHHNSRKSKQNGKSNTFALIIFAIALASLLLCYYLVFARHSSSFVEKKYSIVIDGGSTGTRIHVFEYRVENGKPVFDLGKGGLATVKLSPGLSAYAEDPESAGLSLEGLLVFGRKQIPVADWSGTEIRLMATGGLRVLELGVQEGILESCRLALRRSGFKFRDEWASVITGSDEGIYAWVVANSALGTLGGDPLQTTGILELGGASAQVTFVSNEKIPAEFSHTVKYGNYSYNLYSDSMLNFGQNAAFDSYRDSLVSHKFNLASEPVQKRVSVDPCTPKGYLHDVGSWKLTPGSSTGIKISLSRLQSRGNFTACRSAALALLQSGKEKCSYQHCNVGSTFVPKLRGRFMATENFFYTLKFFELPSRAFLSKLIMAGKQFCEEDWSVLKNKYQSVDEEYLQRYCFSSAYIVALLHDSLEISLDDERITVANQVGHVSLDWALGAFILQTTAKLDTENHNWIAPIMRDYSSMLLILIFISITVMFAGWYYVSKWRKTQLKTIYDLEKGRYIVLPI